MNDIDLIFKKNEEWVDSLKSSDSRFFKRLVEQQNPEYLWIGCSDSRVPANQLMGLLPGDVFVHRNVANLVVSSDLNALSVIHYAVRHLKVKHIIVCGHYGCGGVRSALSSERFGLVDSWLQHVEDVANLHRDELSALSDSEREDRLCELNAIEQANNVCKSTPVRDAWESGQEVHVHCWIYGIADGYIRKLQEPISSRPE